MALTIFLIGKKSESVAINVLMVIFTFHVENAIYGFDLTKTETGLVHTMDINKRSSIASLFTFFPLVTRIVF